MERHVPTFTLISSELCRTALAAPCDLVIMGAIEESRSAQLLRELEHKKVPCICVADESAAVHRFRSDFPKVLALFHHEGWLDSLVVLATEVLRRVDATKRARKAEVIANENTRQATLGRYMIETRHSFNNALTSVLGNAELMLLENGKVPEHLREQVDTIHSMALRLHEMMQRFSSLEMEMQFADRDSQNDTEGRSQAYIAGS